jgi:AraC-like DNA-binding protein
MALHSSFETAEPGPAEDFLSDAYVDLKLRLPDDHAGFRLADERIDAGPFKFDQMTIGATASFAFEPEVEFFAGYVRAGTLRLRQPGVGVDETFTHGEIALIGRPGIDSVTEVEDFRQDVVTFDTASLRDAAGLAPDEPPATFTSVRPVSPERARTWRRAVDLIGGMLHGDPAIADAPIVVGSAERMLAGLLLATFPNTGTALPDRRDERDARSPGTLRRAISFIDSNADLDIGIGEIAAAAEVSRRAVQLAFRRHLGTTPTAYLRRVRLDYAHREMLGAAIDGLTVTEVAYRWGFSSPSRFAERYRATFGVSPSQTLRG